MKKFFAIAFVAASLVACGEKKSDASTPSQDTVSKETTAPVSTAKVDTIKNAAGKDSLYITTSADGKVDTTKAAQ